MDVDQPRYYEAASRLHYVPRPAGVYLRFDSRQGVTDESHVETTTLSRCGVEHVTSLEQKIELAHFISLSSIPAAWSCGSESGFEAKLLTLLPASITLFLHNGPKEISIGVTRCPLLAPTGVDSNERLDAARAADGRDESPDQHALQPGGRLDEALVKDMTGGDRLVGRHLYHPPFEFDPTHKLLLYGNYLPVIRGTDHGIWRRIRLIPFNAQIPESERNPNLGDALLRELPGILRWAVDGCQMWRRDGLGNPPKVEGATADYRAEMDVLGRFLEECTDTRYKVKGADLYEAYAAWAKANGEFALSVRVFGMELTRRGFKKLKANGTLYRTGIRLNPTGEKYRSGWYRVGIEPDDVAS